MLITDLQESTGQTLEDGVIKNVKVLGFKSKNKREYTKEAMAQAVKLYEQASIFVDHATEGTKGRKAEDCFGRLENVIMAEDGLRGDLMYLTTHPMAARVNEDIRRDLKNFGLSHNIDGIAKRNAEGTLVVSRIDKVKSVDLVTGSATCTSLMESIQEEDTRIDETIALTEQVTSLTEQLTNRDTEVTTLKAEIVKLNKRKFISPVSIGLTEQTEQGKPNIPTKDPKALAKWLTSK